MLWVSAEINARGEFCHLPNLLRVAAASESSCYSLLKASSSIVLSKVCRTLLHHSEGPKRCRESTLWFRNFVEALNVLISLSEMLKVIARSHAQKSLHAGTACCGEFAYYI